jgi:hypothetical protein
VKRQPWHAPAAAFGTGLVVVLWFVAKDLSSMDDVSRLDAEASPTARAERARTEPCAPTETNVAAPQASAKTQAPSGAECMPEQPARASLAPSPAAAVAKADAGRGRDGEAFEARLARMWSLQERFEAIAALRERLSDQEAAATYARLLDAELPGTFYEAETLRIYLLGRIAEIPGANADAALIARIDPEKPRPQRLIAVEALAARPAVGRVELEVVARNDHDTVVQERARWALARAR